MLASGAFSSSAMLVLGACAVPTKTMLPLVLAQLSRVRLSL
jgi:hypothetical protein